MANTLMTLLVKLGLDSKDFESGLDNASGKAGGFGKTMKGIGTVAGAAIGATTVAVGAIGAAMASTIGPASDLQETVSKAGVVFGDWAEDVIHFGDSASEALGMSKNQAVAAAGTYGNLFSAMGIGVETSADMSMSLVQLASDLASFNNSNPEDVLNALRSGLSGETEPLKKLGVNLNQALIEAKALELGLYDGEGALDAAAKAQATYALVMEQTSLAQGDFARTSDGLANKQRTLAATVEDIKGAIGTGLLPILESAAGGLSGYLTQVSDLLNNPELSLKDKIGGIGEIIKSLTGDITAALPAILESAVTLVSSLAEGLITALPGIMPAIVQLLLGLVGMIVELAPMLIDAGMQMIITLAMGLAQALPALIPAIIDMLLSILMVIVENIPLLLEAGIQIILGLITGIVNALPLIIEQLPIIVEKIYQVIFDSLPLIMDAAIEIILALVEGIATNLPTLVVAIVDMVLVMAQTIVENLPKLWEAGKDMLKKLIDGIKEMWPGLKDAAKDTMDGFWEGIKSKFEMIWQGIKDFGGQVVEDLKGILGISSPSKVMFGVGKNMMLGLALGLEKYQVEPAGVTIGAAGRMAAGQTIEADFSAPSYGGPSAAEIGRATAVAMMQLGVV